ncbi:hypothetical protein EBU95_14030 [bacterium]|nr:hypothetical protein [bacterium]
MKFCPRQVFTYTSLSQRETTVNYVSYENVLFFHGVNFAKQWFEFIKNKPKIIINGEECFYYADYKHFAIATDMYINSA